jgi:hypothetical protein
MKEINNSLLLKVIERAKRKVKSSDIWKKLCKEYNVNENIIFHIPMMFDELDVSAKTNKGIIILNNKLLENFENNHSYLIHEMNHWFAQCFGDKPTKGSDDGEYLDNKYEVEAFKDQVEYIAEEESKEEAEEYIDDLLDHHDITNREEKKDKKKEFLSQID